MSAAFGIVQYPWNLAGAAGTQLEQAAGKIPLTHVTVPVVTGPLTQMRCGADAGHPWFATPGGYHYPPDADTLAPSGLRPPKARWQGQGDAVARLADAVDRLGLKLIFRVDLRALPQLVEQHGHLAQRNAWGQEMLAAGACALNPEMRELLRLTLADLRRYAPSGFELVSWRPDHVAGRCGNDPIEWHPAVRRLLSLCFCPSCRQVAQRADIDPESVARATRVSFESFLERKPNEIDLTRELDPAIAAYVAAREADCQDWLRRLAEADGQREYYDVQSLRDLSALSDSPPLSRMLLVPSVGADFGAAFEQALMHRPAALSLPAWRPAFGASAELVKAVTAAVQHNVELLDFDGLEQSPEEVITWLHQAVRKAHRV